MEIREERDGDAAAIQKVNALAFAGEAEAHLVESLHREGAVTLSLVGLHHGAVVGHILFSPVTIEGTPPSGTVLGLAPMSVLPAHQRAGFGSVLVPEGIKRCRELGHTAVVVLGHPDFYPRFGFAPADQFGLTCEFPAPREAFMALELQPRALETAAGMVRYHPAFHEL